MRYLWRPLFLPALVLLVQISASAGRVAAIYPLPQFYSPRVMKLDAAGNLYLAGTLAFQGSMPPPGQALVAKFSPDGKLVFGTVFGGLLGQSWVTAMAVAADGSIAVAGNTNSPNFPVTPDAAQPLPEGGIRGTGFFARLDAGGTIRYASYLNSGSEGLSPAGLVLAGAGAAYVTGTGKFTSTSGALPAGPANLGWVAKLDASGKLVFGTGLLGGSAIALDASGSIYIVGSTAADQTLPVTPGAFQSTVKANMCDADFLMSFPCTYQYAAKVDATASRLIYATWISGDHGAVPAGIAVDAAGNLILAGTTKSTDYPVTPGAYQTVNYATISPGVKPLPVSGLVIQVAITGFVTKLNATGTALVFSTFLGGSGSDAIASMTADAAGNIYLGGLTSSLDFPGLSVVPNGCRPSFVYPTAYATRLSADGSALSETQLAYRLAPFQFYPTAFGPYDVYTLAHLPQVALDGAGKASATIYGGVGRASPPNLVAQLDLFAPSPALVCATDAVDYAPLTSIAPGQILTLFGFGLGPDFAATLPPGATSAPISLGGVSATFNGTAAPILYAASGQVNLQVPYEVAGQPSAIMKVTYPSGGSDTLAFTVVQSQPSVFVPTPAFAACGSTETSGVLPLVVNADFTVNGCGNPAVGGTPVYLFLNGLGTGGGNPVTGAIWTEATPLARDAGASVGIAEGRSIPATVSISADPGQINSVWLARIDLPPNVSSPSTVIGLGVHGVSVRERLVIWTR